MLSTLALTVMAYQHELSSKVFIPVILKKDSKKDKKYHCF